MKAYKTLANTEDVLRYCEYYNVPRSNIETATNWDNDVIRIKFTLFLAVKSFGRPWIFQTILMKRQEVVLERC